ncbi:universal stress protein [Variovorax sp. VaC1]|uniref:universal stress protein n=1 Tax=Variovorax sp. VaC1 TaxID=3373132 RepID=UPI00374A5FE6
MYQRILIPIDGSLASAQGVEEAIRVATPKRSRVRLLHVIDDLAYAYADYAWDGSPELHEEGARLLVRTAEQVRAAGIEVDQVLYDASDGTVADLVNSEAHKWHADVIVIGTHGRRGLGRLLLGSSAERIAREASVPVLLVHEAVPAADAAAGAVPGGARPTPSAERVLPTSAQD